MDKAMKKITKKECEQYKAEAAQLEEDLLFLVLNFGSRIRSLRTLSDPGIPPELRKAALQSVVSQMDKMRIRK
jgi:hypothetical protein